MLTPSFSQPIDRMSVRQLAEHWYELFNRTAQDLYPAGHYTKENCFRLAEMGLALRQLAREKNLLFLAHYYMRPEIQKVSHFVGDSLGLGLKAKALTTNRTNQISAVWLSAVRFMGDTVKIILGNQVPVYMPKFSGCSLVASLHQLSFDYRLDSESAISRQLLTPLIDEHPVNRWRQKNPEGLVLSYMNSDPESKAKSWAVFTSRNAARVLEQAMKENPGRRVYLLPDQFLSHFILNLARLNHNPWIKPELVDIFDGLCHVHAQKINPFALDQALARYPQAALAVHPECGCAVDCFLRVSQGLIPRPTFIGSTQEMIEFAKRPDTPPEIIVATETGHVFTLREQVPNKIFHPVSSQATCEFMKATQLEDLYNVICHSDWQDHEVCLPATIIREAQVAIDRMLANA